MRETRIPDPAADRAGGNAGDLPGLYVHIPFCLTKCHYCSFYSITENSLIGPFAAALRREMALYRGWAPCFGTLYLGGGTPSALAADLLEGLIATIRAAFTIIAEAEVTVEANPGDITPDLLASLRRAGVNRINLGVQSLDDGSLALLGRRHTVHQAIDAFHRIRDAGFANIGLDLIYGLPSPSPAGGRSGAAAAGNASHPFAGRGSSAPASGEAPPSPSHAGKGSSLAADRTFALWLATLEQAIALAPEHLSCYQLTLEEKTPLAERCRRGELALPDEAGQADYFYRTARILEEKGYHQYEVSNFSRPGRESQHNRKYWNHTPYLGLGPAAHSFSGRQRRWNHSDLAAYIGDLESGREPVASRETLSDDQLRLEALFLGFRTSRGICLETFKNRYGRELLTDQGDLIGKLCSEGLLEICDGFLRPTLAGLAVADSLALI